MDKLSLSALGVGQSAYVTRVEAEAAMYRRLLDIGLIPGTKVTCTAKSPAGDPSAYLIRGAVIALRAADAGGVCIKRALEQPQQNCSTALVFGGGRIWD